MKIVAKDFPPNTTSNKAAAVWYPFLAQPLDKVGRWASETMNYLKKESEVQGSGVILQKTVELFKNPTADPVWKVPSPLSLSLSLVSLFWTSHWTM